MKRICSYSFKIYYKQIIHLKTHLKFHQNQNLYYSSTSLWKSIFQKMGNVIRFGESSTSWFSDITGFSEDNWTDEKKKEFISEENGELQIRNPKKKQTYYGGSFREYLLGDLQDNLKEKQNTEANPQELIPLEFWSRKDAESMKFLDVSYLQALPENRNAVFQVASNFNAIESISESISPDSRHFTENYIYDRTQGPIASMSAGCGAILRVHAAFFSKNTPPDKWKQTSTNQINFLSNLSQYFPMKNGYPLLFQLIDHSFPSRAEWNTLSRQMKIGYQCNTQVTFNESKNLLNYDQRIDQVFTAALNVAQGMSGKENRIMENSALKAQFLLHSGYEGTYLSAIYNNRKKLYLTLIGGGVFGNNQDWILDAICTTHRKWGTVSSGLEKVVVIIFSGGLTSDFYSELKKYNIPSKITVYEKGNPTVLDDKSKL